MVMMFSPVEAFFPDGREKDSVAAELEGALLISRSVFPYFMLVALEAGGPLRALLFLLVSPLVSLLETLGLQAAALHVMTFVSTAGLRLADVKAAAKATLPRFFLLDTSEKAYEGVFARCGGKKYVLTSMPRIMVEPFLREYLDASCVVATEVRTIGGRCLGLVAPPGVMVGQRRLDALKALLGGCGEIDVGLGDGLQEHPFMLLCGETYNITPTEAEASPLPRQSYPKPLIFHDGRLVKRPTPLHALVLLLWLPASIFLAVARILLGLALPFGLQPMAGAALGMRVDTSFAPTAAEASARDQEGGIIYACCHRTLLDPVITACVLQQRLVAVTYSLSAVSEILSPIPTVRLSRNRARDAETMRGLLERRDLVVCPEGTTCREPYLLRFSPLFAEVAKEIVPLAILADGSMFYGSTVRGYKWLDSFFFLMNPFPEYRLRFLDAVAGSWDGAEPSGGGGYEVANRIQQAIAGELGYECTNLTRRDKYRMIAGNDGLVAESTP
ncbi:hypothetical protein Taro_041414 [Colocasia esculenta]|uniref:Phospholipid/glycerol acyltransferase domain-containing protein n=1 Tax=Colocasia esculenta TaxID=4460 RepID=A0A843WBF5_COLES|nr:hypothetical protein [Colocasia esculenta]